MARSIGFVPFLLTKKEKFVTIKEAFSRRRKDNVF